MNKLISRLDKLRAMDELQVKLAIDIVRSDGGNFYSLDMVFLAALNRSCSNISGFIQMIEAENYCAAAPFIRMQLDSVLRLYALRLVDNPNKLAHQILRGVQLNKTKDRSNNKMSDAYLRECVAKFEPWISSVYEAGSGFIHLSEKHIFSLFTKVDNDGTFEICISGSQPHIKDAQQDEAAAAMVHVTFLLINLCKDWLVQKSRTNQEST